MSILRPTISPRTDDQSTHRSSRKPWHRGVTLVLILVLLTSLVRFSPSAEAYDESYFRISSPSNSYNYTSGGGVVKIGSYSRVYTRAFYCGFLYKNDCMNFKDGYWSVTSSRVSGSPRYGDQAKVVASVDVDYWKFGISGASISTSGAAGLSFTKNSGTVGCNTGNYYSATGKDDVSLSTAPGVEFCKIVQPATILNGVIASHFSKAKATTSGAVRFNGTTWKAANTAVATKNY